MVHADMAVALAAARALYYAPAATWLQASILNTLNYFSIPHHAVALPSTLNTKFTAAGYEPGSA